MRLCLALVLVAFSALALAGQTLAADPVVDAVGDMNCALSDPNYNGGNGNPSAVPPANNCLQKSVSDLIASPLPTALLDLGDNQYNNGELANYNSVYDPTFGRANSVVYPSLGNAEYNTANASGFFGYFGQPSTGVFSRIQADGGNNTNLTTGGYYSFSLGAWHVIALNTNCSKITHGCGAGSPEEKWLKADLAAHPGMCTLAYWHHPRWNSGSLGNDSSSAAFWTDLYAAHADVVLNGHGNHHYERFVPQNASGAPDPNGIREFIVSTGGQSHGVPPAKPGDQNTSVLTNYSVYGMLQLTLHPTGYDWRYVAAGGSTFTDSGTGTCHSAAPPPPPFPSTPVLDDFARAPGALGASWQSPALHDSGKVTITSSGLTAGSTSASSATWTAAKFAADQQAYLTVSKLPAAGDFVQVTGRVSTLSSSTVSLYFVRVTPSRNLWDLRKKINGRGSTSMKTFTAPLAAGDAVGLQINGATITAYRQPSGGAWASVGSAIDSSITAGGYIGFTLGDTTIRGGAFGGGS